MVGKARFSSVFAVGAVALAWGALLQAPKTAFAVTPGALGGHRYEYADSWTGWPVAPLHRQHPIRGSFLDPRAGYHFGIDVNVRDDRPEPGAPPGRSHRVYAVESGVVAWTRDGSRFRCFGRRLGVGHFAYWHVDPTVSRGRWVRAGQMIGWTCAGAWHVHLSEWTQLAGRRVWVNPLHRGGKLRPFSDTARPVVHDVRFHPPPLDQRAELAPTQLHGLVDIRARISDPQSFRGWMVERLSALVADHHPYRLMLRVTRLRDGKTWIRSVFRADALLSSRLPSIGTPVPFTYHYGPGTSANLKAETCLRRQPVDCRGTYWLRLFARPAGAYWDTRAFENGAYRVAVAAFDLRGNGSTRRVDVTIAN
jgi:hypothetical protein